MKNREATAENNSQSLAEASEYMNKVRSINTGANKKACVITYGCQMNDHDSQKLMGMLKEMGYLLAADESEADFIIYNTCCIRENAENKVYGNLGRCKNFKEENKNLMVAVCGCMMQQAAVVDKIKKSYSNVDIIFGTFNLHRFPQLLYTSLTTGSKVIDIWEAHGEHVELLPRERQSKYKASINIMYGCNNFCSYCIVPYVRGRERSRPYKEILDEVNLLADTGVRELMLLGQNVNSYGNGIDEISFPKLLREIDEAGKIKRIRFMTSHPKDLSQELIQTIKDCKSVCKSIHLPFQSGSSKILGAMNRKYTKEDYLDLVNRIKASASDITITTDIIVGFPGETEEDFADTMEVVQKVRFMSAYTFIYSKRVHTPAAEMDDQIPEDIAKERFNRLLSKVNEISNEISGSYVGSTLEVLCESYNPATGIVTGRSDYNNIVHFKGSEKQIGEFADIKIKGYKTFYLIGEDYDSI